MKYLRNIDLKKILTKKSVLLLGPRSTGKTFYIKNQLDNIHYINLLRSKEFLLLNSNPEELENIVKLHKNKIIVIDEIQKIPKLLDEVHHLIEEYGAIFLLTGSSARKLKSHGVNLLAGRAWPATMHPLNYQEIFDLENSFDLSKYLQFGSLPQVWNSSDPLEDLDSYVQTYIDMEIKIEGIVRKIPAFSRFIKVAALNSGELLNYQNIASDAQVPATTVRDHYQILEDTLIGYNLESWKESKKRKAIQTSKFYFFDVGVLNHITSIGPISKNTVEWGNRFEHFIINELRAVNSYQRRKYSLNFWRSTAGHEVDILFGKTAIEIKSSENISRKYLKGLFALREEKSFKEYILVSQDKKEREINGIKCLHFENFLKKVWSGDF